MKTRLLLGARPFQGSPAAAFRIIWDSLENHAFRISLYRKDTLHPKNVLALGAEKFGEPFVELRSIAVTITFNSDAGNFVVVTVVMVLVFFLQEVRIDFHGVV